MNKITNEYRPTMDNDVLHSWAKDAVEEIKRLEAEVVFLKEEVRAVEEDFLGSAAYE